MTDSNEGLLRRIRRSSGRIRFPLEETAVTPEEAQLLVKFGNSKLRGQARVLLKKNGHRVT